jgi:hypothetical protein
MGLLYFFAYDDYKLPWQVMSSLDPVTYIENKIYEHKSCGVFHTGETYAKKFL